MYSSTDGVNYQKVTSGTWENSTIQELATFNPIAAKYVKLVVLNGVNGLTSVAEVNVFGY
ncbi:hypothetical protein BAU28_16275 [Bacillus paramycoides]|uniref:F5/8 type C domain-containing protein n=1 Tax=Bacillus paramycoides TaxID=2026194 RepID=A0A1J9UE91_9BACI|nr:hypothetical protein BAU28_16275 [Bacillus paramycoides]